VLGEELPVCGFYGYEIGAVTLDFARLSEASRDRVPPVLEAAALRLRARDATKR